MAKFNIVQDSFKYNILALKLLGLYPCDSLPKCCYSIYAYIFYILFTVPIPVLASVYLIVNKVADLERVVDSAFLISELALLMIKLLPFKNHPESIKRTIYTLEEDKFNTYIPEQENILKDSSVICKRMFFIFLSSCLASLVLWASKVFFYEIRRFPIDVWTPYEPFEGTWVYLGTFLFLFSGVFNAAVGTASVDTLIAGLICHTGGQLKILKDTLMHIGERANEQVRHKGKMSEEKMKQMTSQLIYQQICSCVNHYYHIYEYVKDLEQTYSNAIFAQFIASILVLCISCLELLLVEPLTMPFFAMVTYVISMVVEIFLFCYFGTVLYEESNTVVQAVYMSDWYTYDEKSQKALIILIERAKRPMMIRAGSLLDVSLDTLNMILRRSYSLLAVLKNY